MFVAELLASPPVCITQARSDILDLLQRRGFPPRWTSWVARLRLSLYTDDDVISLNPTATHVANVEELLDKFGRVTGLNTNIHKSSVSPIRCAGIDLNTILVPFSTARTSFPIKYLGLPPSLDRLKRVDFQPVSDKANSRLANWLEKFFTAARRRTLVKLVLSAQRIYYLSSLNAPAEVLEEIDKRRKRFLWTGTNQIAGGKCKVA